MTTCWLKSAINKLHETKGPYVCGFIENRFTPGRKWQASADGSYQWARNCDFIGNDLISKSMASYSECGEACKANQNCAYFTFSVNSTCFLKNVIAFFPETYSDGPICGVVPARKSYNQQFVIDFNSRQWQTSKDESYKWSKNCDFTGMDLVPWSAKKNVTDYVACAELCKSLPNCNYFTLNIFSTCFPKNSPTPMNVSSQYYSIYCGFFPKRNGSPVGRNWQISDNGNYKWSNGCDYFGNDLLPWAIKSNITDYVTCAEYCHSNPLCTFFTFNKLRSLCFPKATSDYFAENNNTEGAVCGFMLRKQINISPSVTTSAVKMTPKVTTSVTTQQTNTDDDIVFEWFSIE